jgi:hypothetical protein
MHYFFSDPKGDSLFVCTVRVSHLKIKRSGAHHTREGFALCPLMHVV